MGVNLWADLQNVPGELAARTEIDRAERIGNLSRELGMSPAEVAHIVVDGIRNDAFYILTHDQFDAPIRERMEAILQLPKPVPYRSEIGD
jgi:hypothetical protein